MVLFHTNFHVEELALVDGQMGAFLVTPWTSVIAIAHRGVLIEAKIEVEDALRIRVIHQIDGEAEIFKKVVAILLNNHLMWPSSYRLP